MFGTEVTESLLTAPLDLHHIIHLTAYRRMESIILLLSLSDVMDDREETLTLPQFLQNLLKHNRFPSYEYFFALLTATLLKLIQLMSEL